MDLLKKDREICHLGLRNGPKGLTDKFYVFKNSRKRSISTLFIPYLKDNAFTAAEKDAKFSRGLRAGSIVLSERMNDWRYLSLRDLKQNEFFPKVNLKVLLYLNVNYGLVTCHVTKK